MAKAEHLPADNYTRDDPFERKLQKIERLSIPTKEGFSFVDTRSIIYLSADGHDTIILLDDKTSIVSSMNLGFYETELEYEPFVRIHHGMIINVNKVRTYLRGDNGYVKMIGCGEMNFPVSRTKKDYLLKFFTARRRTR